MNGDEMKKKKRKMKRNETKSNKITKAYNNLHKLCITMQIV